MTGLTLLASGKVRELYDLGDDLLMVASDRISTYDVVHPTPIPDKGKVLTGLSVLWFDLTKDIVPNHLVSVTEGVPDEFRGRGMRVKRLRMLPVECVVRGYITGSGWKDYQATGKVSGIELPPGLQESEQLPEPIFTPSTKADVGHDEAIDFDQAAELAGSRELGERLRDVSLAVYQAVADHARERGDHPRRHQVRVRARRRTASSCSATRCARRTRRASGPPTSTRSGAASRASTSSTCATGRRAPAGTRRRPAPADPRRRRGADARALRDRVRAAVRRAVLGLAGAHRSVRVRVLIRPKAGILDPQGQAVERALPALGFDGVRNVHVGRLVELDVEDPSQVDAMCERLLTNP